MENFQLTHPLMERDRPPGGTRRTGVKTPRKVQWLDPQEEERNSEASTRALDEHGVNLEPFENLTDALERHRASPAVTDPNTYDTRRVQTASTMTTDSSPETLTLDNPPTHTVGGETYIDRNETAGLPGTNNLEEYSQKRAAAVVQAHRHGFFSRRFGLGGLARRRKGGSGPSRSQSGEREREHPEDVESAAEAAAAAPVRQGMGVLSTLLSLYEHEHASTVSGFSTPGRSSIDWDESRAGSLYETMTKDSTATAVEPPHQRQHSQDSQSKAPVHLHPLEVSTSAASEPDSPTWSAVSPQPPGKPSQAGHHHHRIPTSLPLFGEKRPASARSSAGVFGALIASTGNISGAAAPTNSTLAPEVKRPGYHLSRYSWDTAVPRPESTVRKGKELHRPQSMHFPIAEAPSVGSSTPTHASDSPMLGPLQLAHSRSGSATDGGTPDSHGYGSTPPSPSASTMKQQSWAGFLRDMPRRGWSRIATPTASTPGTPATGKDEWLSEKDLAAYEGKEKDKEGARHKERKRRRKRAEIYITRHVAEIIQRQEFICKLARSFMMFGGPSHRLQAQVLATARVLDVTCSCMYLPDMMLVSFDDVATGTSNIKLVRQGGAFDIYKLQEAYKVYWKVIHDDISVNEASVALDTLMTNPAYYNKWQLIFFGGMCSASICSVSFSGSFIDCLISFPLGCILIIIQLFAAKHELYSNVFEITVATLFSFVAAALSTSGHFCYSAVAASSVVLILPGYIILCGVVELSSHNLVSGAVRVCFSVIYSLFLGFGLAIGATLFTKISGKDLKGQDDITCGQTHRSDGPWYQRTPSVAWAFLSVPMYSLWLSLRFYAPWNRKELPLLVAISCLGWATNHFTGLKFPGQNDVSSAAGAFAVGFVSNLYARFFKGNAFVIMIIAILFQLPSGVANGGLFTFVSEADAGGTYNEVYLSGFQTALQLVSVALGLTVGLGVSLVCVFPIQSRRRAAGIFSL